MPSTGKMNGNAIGIYIGSTLVTHSLNHTFTVNMSPIDTTTKDSAGDAEHLAGLRNAEFSASFYFAEDATYGYEDLWDAWKAGTTLTVKTSSGVTGDNEYSASAHVTSLSITAEHDGNVSCDASFAVTGAVTKATIV